MHDVLTAYRKAGFPRRHGEAFQAVANELDRIIVSRCAQEIGIQLLEEGYASKGFGIKAKSCDWGPFAGFAMGHFQFSKLETGTERYRKQIAFFKASGHTGFQHETNDPAARAHIQMAAPDVLRLTTARLQTLASLGKIRLLGGINDGDLVTCDGPYGPLAFWLVKQTGASPACWALAHRISVPAPLRQLALANQGTTGVDDAARWGKVELVKGMVNLLPDDRNHADPAKNCVAGDYDLWAVFPKKGSSMAKHGMDRQARIFAGVNPSASAGIKNRVAQLQQDTLSRAPVRTQTMTVNGQKETYRYQEDPELGNVSPLLMDTMHALNRRVRAAGYPGGRMVHHNDDLGNPFRSDVEKQLIAFIPNQRAYFIDDSDYYPFIKPFEEQYAVYDNPAIWAQR